MKKLFKITNMFLVTIIAFAINNYNVLALSGKFELTSNKKEVDVNDTIDVTVKVSEDGNSLGSWQASIVHSDNLTLVSGDENIVDVVGDTNIKEKEYFLSYKAISSGEATINITDEKIIDYDSEEEITTDKDSIKINIKSSKNDEQINQPTIKSEVKNEAKFVVENGYTYYYVNGVMQKGIVEVDGKKYLFGVNSGMLYYGWATTPDGSKYYSDSEGVLKSGVTEIDGKLYLFGVYSNKLYYGWATTPDGNRYYSDKNGVVQTGLKTVNNKNYYFSSSGALQYGIQTIDNKKYYFDENGVMQKGIVEVDEKKYLFGVNSGMLYYGWATTPDGSQYYSDSEGVLKSGVTEIDGKLYLFGVYSNKLYYGWATTPDGNRYYSDKNGVVQTGKVKINGKTYYFDENGALIQGMQIIDNKKYYFDENGVMQKGIVEISNRKYFFDQKNGQLIYGWGTDSEGNKYYSDSEGVLKSGVTEIDGKLYLFGIYSNKLYYGWATTPDGSKYYSDSEGVLKSGLIELNDKKYWFSDDGKLYVGWFEKDGEKYYSNKNGELQNGVIEIGDKKYLFGIYSYKLYYGWATTPDGSKYYSDSEGVLKSGVSEIDGKLYLFGVYSNKLYYGWATLPNGDKYYTNNEGIVQTGIQTIDGISYNFSNDGKLQSGYQTINGKTYYYYSDGSIAKGIVKIQGERNYFDFTTGELLRRNVKSIIDVSYGQTTIDWDTLWNSGQIDGVIIRVGYGTSKTDNPVLDSYFAYNIAAVKRLGIPYSVYIFGYAQTTYAAEKEATFVANALNSYGATNLSMPIFYDAEISYWNGLDYTSDVYTTTITAFANKLKNLGFNNVGVYGSYSWFTDANGRLNSEVIRNYPLWVAQYYRKCSYTDPLVGWQYTSSGSLPGIPTRVDMNIFF